MEYCDRKKKLKSFKFRSCLYAILGLLVFLTGCPKTANKAQPQGMGYYNFFDTVSYIYSYAGDSPEKFEANCANARDLYVVKNQKGEFYIPAVPEFITDIDPEDAIYVRPIPGLIEGGED